MNLYGIRIGLEYLQLTNIFCTQVGTLRPLRESFSPYVYRCNPTASRVYTIEINIVFVGIFLNLKRVKHPVSSFLIPLLLFLLLCTLNEGYNSRTTVYSHITTPFQPLYPSNQLQIAPTYSPNLCQLNPDCNTINCLPSWKYCYQLNSSSFVLKYLISLGSIPKT